VQFLRDAFYWYKRRQFEPGFEAELDELVALAEDPPID